MSILSISRDSLATIGISTASPSQLSAVRDTVAGGQGSRDTGKDDSPKTQVAQKTEYTPSDRRRIAELARIDAEVRAHERAHINVGRDLITSGPDYGYTYGPDGKQYAVSGEVGIDTAAAQEPQANIDKGLRIQHTALAPANPSPQDYAVASTGKELEEQGRTELREQQLAEAEATREKRAQADAGAEGPARQVDLYA